MKFISTRRFINAALVMALLTIAIVFSISLYQQQKIKDTAEVLGRSKVVFTSVRNIMMNSMDIQNGARAYVMTENEKFITQIKVSEDSVISELRHLRQLLVHFPEQHDNLDSLEWYIHRRIENAATLIDFKVKNQPDSAIARIDRSLESNNTSRIRYYARTIEQAEMNMLVDRKKFFSEFIGGLNTFLYVFLLIILVLSLVIYNQVKQGVMYQKVMEDKFRSLVESSPDALIISNEEGVIQMLNWRAEEIFGYNRDELTGQSIEVLLPENNRSAHIAQRAAYLNDQVNRLKDGGRELPARRKDGSVFMTEITLSPIKTGEESLIAASVRDITARIEARNQLESLSRQVNQAKEAIYTLDKEFQITSWNYGAQRIFGYSSREAIGRNAKDMVVNVDRAWFEELTSHLMNHGGWTGEINKRRKDGTVIQVLSSLTTVQNEKGEVIGFISVGHDITTQKILQQEKDYLARIVEQSSEAIISRDLNRNVLSWNKGAETLFGYSREEVQNKNLLDLDLVDLSLDELKALEKLVEKDGTWRREVRFKRKNGSTFIGDTIANGLFDDQGRLVSVGSYIHDISLQKSLEQQLIQTNQTLEEKVKARTEEIRRSEQKYRYLFHHNPIPMWVIETGTFRFLDVNEMALLKYGYSREEFLNMTAEDIRPEHTRSAFRRENNPKTSHLNDGYRGVWQHQKKDGTAFWVEIIAHHILFEGKHARLILANDITEKKEAEDKLRANEKRFRAMIEHNNDMIAMMDADGKLIYRSPSTFRITGMTNETANELSFLDDIVHPDDRATVTELFSQVLENPGQATAAAYRGKHQDGHYIHVEGTLTNLLDDPAVRALVFNFRDVTLEKEASDKLIASEKRYREALDNMIEGVQILGFDWKYLYVNDAVVNQSRTRKEDLVGFTLMEKFPGIENTELYKVFQRCFEDRTPQHMENRFVYPDGESAWFELSFQPIPEGVFVLSIDITERKLAVAALKEERDKLAAISLTSPGLIYSFRLSKEGKLNFVYASHAFSEIFGFEMEEVGDSFLEIAEKHSPEDIQHILDSIPLSAQQLTDWQQEFRYHHPVKGLRWLKAHSYPQRERDGSTIWHGIIMDITESKLSEEKILEQSAQLQTLSNNLPGVMIFQLAGNSYEDRKFTFVSKEVTRLTGHTPEEVMENPMILYDLILEEDRPLIFEREKESYTSFTPFHVEVRALTKDKDQRWLSIVSAPRKLNDGSIVWDGFHVDITDRKAIEKRIRDLNMELEEKVRIRTRQLQKINEELEAFTYSVSHDLRAPLRTITGFTRILRDDYASKLDGEAQRIGDIIHQNTVKMGVLIDDLLSFARLGGQAIDKASFDTHEMVNQVIASFEQKMKPGLVSWDIDDLHPSEGDITTLRQVWINLIGNALKYARSRTPIKIHIGSAKEAGETIFFVRDNGVGFDQRYANKLFKVFQRLHSADEFEGTGVGLAIVEKIISKHGGRVWAEGVEDQGACFYFSLPYLNEVLME